MASITTNMHESMIKHKENPRGTRKYGARSHFFSKTSRFNMAIDRRKFARPKFLAEEKKN